MFETIYLTSAEKREFIHEFTGEIILAAKGGDKLKIIEKSLGKVGESGVEAAGRIKPIIRQFPALGGMITPAAVEEESEEKEIPEKAVEASSFSTLNEKVDNLLNDFRARIIECSEGVIKISRGQGIEETGFRLNEQEVKNVIKRFSEKSKTPFTKGVFKAKLGGLVINAMISDVINSRFLIMKD